MEKHPEIIRSITIAYAVLIFYLSSIPAAQPSVLEKVPLITTIEHRIEYAVLGFLLFFSFRSIKKDVFWIVILAGFLYGVSDEIHQFFTPGRFCDIWDVASDSAGVLIGVFAGKRFILWKNKK